MTEGVKKDLVKQRVNLGVTMQAEEMGFIRVDVSQEKDMPDTEEAFDNLSKNVYKRLEKAVKAMMIKFNALKEEAMEDFAE